MRFPILLTASVFAVPALAETSAAISFFHGGANVALPMPTHFCSPIGDDQTRFAADTSAGIPNAEVKVVLLRCDRPFALETLDYTVIASPNGGAISMPVSRADMIREMRAYLATNPDIAGIANRAREKASDNVSKAVGEKVDMTGQIVPRGTDDDCVYLGGKMTMSVSEKTVSLIAAECLTSVNNHVIAILRYRVGDDIAAVPALLSETRVILRSMRGTEVS